jgi:hypothetical protein
MSGDKCKPQINSDFWQSKAKQSLTTEDQRQIKENLAGFFNILNDWQKKEYGNGN